MRLATPTLATGARLGSAPRATPTSAATWAPRGRWGAWPDAETRAWRNKAHAALDTLWRRGDMSRSAAYGWMATAMGLPQEEAHMGRMDPDECRRLIHLVKARSR
ncbi:zinc-finger-containing protein [Luteimonas kalidii]|uniref:zinc-finger-containing protein n=1 Tax=Luteimonas kalidii TaxID=3042025 RepID=UPI003CE58B63